MVVETGRNGVIFCNKRSTKRWEAVGSGKISNSLASTSLIQAL